VQDLRYDGPIPLLDLGRIDDARLDERAVVLSALRDAARHVADLIEPHASAVPHSGY
jgi:hypothetical protein